MDKEHLKFTQQIASEYDLGEIELRSTGLREFNVIKRGSLIGTVEVANNANSDVREKSDWVFKPC